MIFFVDGPSETRKIIFISTSLEKIKLRGMLALTSTNIGIVATISQRGYTTHSRFEIPSLKMNQQ